jgi:hypothetical protein
VFHKAYSFFDSKLKRYSMQFSLRRGMVKKIRISVLVAEANNHTPKSEKERIFSAFFCVWFAEGKNTYSACMYTQRRSKNSS